MMVDVATVAGYVLLGIFVLARFWKDPAHRYTIGGYRDPVQFEWFIATGTDAITHLKNPLYTYVQNAPLGVNLMGNASILGLVVPLLPVTLLFGPTVSYGVTISGGMAATAAGWYWVFNREFKLSRLAAATGGLFCGFAPPIVSHANGHPNFTALFLVPFIVRSALRLPSTTRPLRTGIVLGLLITWQVFIGEEILVFTALGLAVFVLGYAAMRPEMVRAAWRPLLSGLAVAAAVAAVLLAYPLWYQFFGPRHWNGLDTEIISNDLTAFTGYSPESLGHQSGAQIINHLRVNPTEQNAFFGWPLMVLVAAIAVALWRNVAARASALVAGVFLVCSLGSEVYVRANGTGVPGPWKVMRHLPLLDSVLPARLTYIAIPAIGALLAIATHWVLERTRQAGFTPRALWIGALAAALLPIMPTPLPAADLSPTPRFFTTGTWRQYVSPSRTLVSAPVGLISPEVNQLRWQTSTGLEWSIPAGYFVGPYGPDHRGRYGGDARRTGLLTWQAAAGQRVAITEAERAVARDDLRYWRADAVIMVSQPHQDVLRQVLDDLLGPGRRVDDVWVWDVRPLTR